MSNPKLYNQVPPDSSSLSLRAERVVEEAIGLFGFCHHKLTCPQGMSGAVKKCECGLVEAQERIIRALLAAHDIAEEGRLSALRHCARLEGLLASQEAAPSAQWQDIATAPKDGTSIVAWMRDWHPAWPEHGVGVVQWTDHNGGGWVSYRRGTPTHWMPLPSPPAQEGSPR